MECSMRMMEINYLYIEAYGVALNSTDSAMYACLNFMLGAERVEVEGARPMFDRLEEYLQTLRNEQE